VPSVGPPTFPDVRSATAAPLPLCGTLARGVIPVVDRLRNLYTTFGLRPYVVTLVKTRWSGGRRSVGVELLVDNPVALLPTPLLSDLTAVAHVVTPVGLDEFGGVLLSEVSGSYTEDFLRGHDGEGRPVQPDEQFYYEVEFPPPCEGRDGDRRRFVMKGAPMYFADRFQWTIQLERARMDRTRAGDPR
jgi:hypothetical protein